MEAFLADGKELQVGDVVAGFVASYFLAVAIAVGGCPEAQPVARVAAVLHGPCAVGIVEQQACPLAGLRLVVGAQLVGAVPLGLQQQSVVVDVAQAESVAVRLDGEDLREVVERIGRLLEEQGLVAIVLCVLQADEQVGIVAGQHEVAVVSQGAEFFG